MTFSRHATVNYTGTIMEGSGTATAGTGAFNVPVSFPRRIGEPEGVTSPEELIAAAHATCYAMVVTGALGRASAVEAGFGGRFDVVGGNRVPVEAQGAIRVDDRAGRAIGQRRAGIALEVLGQALAAQAGAREHDRAVRAGPHWSDR